MKDVKEKISISPVWTIRRYYEGDYEAGKDPYDVSVFRPNLLLNEGIAELLSLLTGGTATAYNNANSYLGVGTDNTAAAATQTGLLGTAVYVGMEAGYPSISAQTVTWRSVFDGSTANQSWQEFTVANANSNAGDNLNRLVSNQGTKTSGQTWTLDLAITFS